MRLAVIKIPEKEEIDKFQIKRPILLTEDIVKNLILYYKMGIIDYPILAKIFDEMELNYEKPKSRSYFKKK